MRNDQVTRQWRLLVLLRRRAWTLLELADALNVSKRTVQRDLSALQQVPLPILGDGHDKHRCSRWTLEAMPEWPRNSATPVQEIRL